MVKRNNRGKKRKFKEKVNNEQKINNEFIGELPNKKKRRYNNEIPNAYKKIKNNKQQHTKIKHITKQLNKKNNNNNNNDSDLDDLDDDDDILMINNKDDVSLLCNKLESFKMNTKSKDTDKWRNNINNALKNQRKLSIYTIVYLNLLI